MQNWRIRHHRPNNDTSFISSSSGGLYGSQRPIFLLNVLPTWYVADGNVDLIGKLIGLETTNDAECAAALRKTIDIHTYHAIYKSEMKQMDEQRAVDPSWM